MFWGHGRLMFVFQLFTLDLWDWRFDQGGRKQVYQSRKLYKQHRYSQDCLNTQKATRKKDSTWRKCLWKNKELIDWYQNELNRISIALNFIFICCAFDLKFFLMRRYWASVKKKLKTLDFHPLSTILFKTQMKCFI